MSVYLQTTRRFVYGDFPDGRGKHTLNFPDPTEQINRVLTGSTEPLAAFAVEIIHEYSANQFVGKLFRRSTSGSWVPVDGGRLSTYEWYKRFEEKQKIEFDMEGSGPWEVLHFRIESDETGPYVAVALQYAQQQVAVG